ncbi:MAG: transglutaminase [Clostridia bacterium BRH_c25]|nr:MAG: transglutaminase [Clostridia bacterium BRH_c25]
MNVNENFRYLNIGLSDDILRRKFYGDFAGAIRLIDKKLSADNIPEALRNCLKVQREIILRLPDDYPLTKEEALAVVREHIPDFTEEEFIEREDAGKIDWIYIDGVSHYFNRFFETMCKTDAAFAKRAGVIVPGTATFINGEPTKDHAVRIMQKNGRMTNRIRCRASVRIKDEFFEKGKLVRVHLPIPCACEQQSDIKIEKLYTESGFGAPETAPQRTVCWEEIMEENHEFFVEFSYIHTAKYNDVSRILPAEQQPSFDTEEISPHVVFTPYIRELVRTLTEGVNDPLEKAKKFYDFITLNVKYSFMRAYFGLENISETCARSFVGDCGVQALLFITLCRCAGIPARWQSGWIVEPEFCGAHDWAMFYVAPHGWLYADPSFGGGAVREGNEVRRQHYFGSLDAYRMVANSEFQVQFTTPKQQWRADPYDNQLGEIETEDRGLRYFEYERTKEVLSCVEI